MKVKVRLFSIAKDLAGFDERLVEVPNGASAERVLLKLVENNPRLAEWKSSLRLAVNHEYVADSFPLNDGDEVAVIPPVSGG